MFFFFSFCSIERSHCFCKDFAVIEPEDCGIVQIAQEFERFSTHLPDVKVGTFYGGIPIKEQKEALKKGAPSIVVGTPGRVKQVCTLVELTFTSFILLYPCAAFAMFSFLQMSSRVSSAAGPREPELSREVQACMCERH